MDADAELDATLRWKTRVALRHSILHLDGATNSVNHAAKLDEDAVSRPLDHAPVVYGDGRIDQIAGSPFTTRQSSTINRSGLVRGLADARSDSPASA